MLSETPNAMNYPEANWMKGKRPLKREPLKRIGNVPLLYADEGDVVLIEGEILWTRDGKMLLARVQAEVSAIDVKIFHPTSFHRRLLARGTHVRLRGKLSRWHGRTCLVNPRITLR